MDKRRIVQVGQVALGNGTVYVQSMLSVAADDVDGNVAQALELQRAGCDIVRVAVPTLKDVRLIHALKSTLTMPVVADIHFDSRIAIESVRAGADKIRINPGNIGSDDRVRAVVDECKRAGVPIRVGVNGGSVKVGKTIVQSALEHITVLERFDFFDIAVSVKSSDVCETVAAYRELARLCPYPLHLGVTEAGTERMGLIKSAVGIGALLCDGIGDTIRVSLTADPVREIEAAFDILRAVGRSGIHPRLANAVKVVSCPTCGRCGIDVVSLANQVEQRLSRLSFDKPLKIAVMGCVVNGPGECKDADFGITGGNGEGLIFRDGAVIRKVHEKELLSALLSEIEIENYGS